MRLNKYIARSTGMSRREADGIIIDGRVTVNGKQTRVGTDVDDDDTIAIDHKVIAKPSSRIIIMMNKPIGYVCSRNAQAKGAKTIYDILPNEYKNLKSIGRLDKDSTGLILLTNDGDLAHKLTHPSFAKTKEYIVTLNKPLAPLHQQIISDFGLQLEDGTSRLLLERLDDNRLKFGVTMTEGRNRQIRRTFASLGYIVESLHRISFGNYTLDNLDSGKIRIIEK